MGLAEAANNTGSNIIVLPIKSKSKVISLKLNEMLVYFLDRTAYKLNTNRSELIRALIKAFIMLTQSVDLDSDDLIVMKMSVKKDGKEHSIALKLGNGFST